VQRSYLDIDGRVTTETRQGGKEEMVSHWILHRAMLITFLCAVLLSKSPALADAIGTSTTVKPVSRTTVIEVPRDGEGREGRETQGMSIPLFIDGVVFGLPLGLLLGYRGLRWWQGRQKRQHDMDQLTEQFQALFRKSVQGRNPYS
jgi:hypothetical protein